MAEIACTLEQSIAEIAMREETIERGVRKKISPANETKFLRTLYRGDGNSYGRRNSGVVYSGVRGS